MKLLVLYRPDSEYAADVETFVRDFQRLHDIGDRLEILSVNTRDGASMSNLYDVMSFPSFLALADNGSVLNSWQGSIPLMDEVAGYIYA